MRRLAGSGVLILIVIGVIVLIALIPLFAVYKSTCGRGEKQRTEYSFVAPWNDPPPECRDHQSGFDIVKDAVGLD